MFVTEFQESSIKQSLNLMVTNNCPWQACSPGYLAFTYKYVNEASSFHFRIGCHGSITVDDSQQVYSTIKSDSVLFLAIRIGYLLDLSASSSPFLNYSQSASQWSVLEILALKVPI